MLSMNTNAFRIAALFSCATIFQLTEPAASKDMKSENKVLPSPILYKTMDLCGEDFQVSKLHEAAAEDGDVALALRHMEEQKVFFSPYCYLRFYELEGARVVDFHPLRFEPSEFLGSPSPLMPSYSVTIDPTRRQVIIGHYVK